MTICANLVHDVLDGCTRLRHPCPESGGKRAKWESSLRQFCQKVASLVEKIGKGNEIEESSLKKIQARIGKIETLAPKSERKQIQQLKQQLDSSIRQFEESGEFLAPEPIPAGPLFHPFKNTPKNWLLQLLNLQSSLGMGRNIPIQETLSQMQRAHQLQADPLSYTCAIDTVGSWRVEDSSSKCYSLQGLEESIQQSMPKTRPIFNEKELEKYGNKHKNLIKMHQLVEELQIEELKIPIPHGVTTEQIAAFLKTHAHEVQDAWKKLQDLYSAHQSFSPFLETKEATTSLEIIDQAIEKAFKDAPLQEKRKLLSSQMQNWLQEIEAAGEYLMVRSTGAEDSKQLANAGGNLSEAYVNPKDVFTAIGKVVRSYFGKPSLQNRINANLNPFQEELSLAVTVQQLIGERIEEEKESSQIPTSFVLFSNEPLYIADELFRVMRISASYGHGEAVVGSQGIATDTFLVLRSESKPDQLYTFADVQNKPERLAPVMKNGRVALEKIQNPAHLENQSTLSKKEISSLYRMAVLMESFFDDKATDIEGVIKNNQIHFVQARPVNRKPLLPTYLDERTSGAILEKHQAEMLVPGKASLISIENKDQILRAKSLAEAERLYDQNLHRLILVEQSEPENSHPVVNFSSLGVPCLYTQDPAALSNLLDKMAANRPLAVCMQTATINLWDLEKGSLKDHTVEGFAVHPAKIGASLSLSSSLVSPLFAQDYSKQMEPFKELFAQIREDKGALQALEAIENHPLVQSLRENKKSLEKQFHQIQYPSQAIAERLEALNQIDEVLGLAIDEIKAVIQSKGENRLQKLFHLKALQTLILGSTNPHLGSYRLFDALPIYKSAQELIDYQDLLPHLSHCADLLLFGAEASQEAFDVWKEFLYETEYQIESGEIPKEQLQDFQEIVQVIKESGALPTWLTLFQKKGERDIWTAKKSSLLDTTTKSLTPSARLLMKGLVQEQKWIQKMESQADSFSDPQTFAHAWTELKEHMQAYTSPSWTQEIKGAPPILRTVACHVLEKGIALIDKAIKSLKVSPEFEETKKAELFKEMVSAFTSLSRHLSLELAPIDLIPTHWGFSHLDYFSRIDTILSASEPTPQGLRPSPDFSVSGAMLGSLTAFYRHLPQTLEDLFTLAHQNALQAIVSLNHHIVSPEEIKQSLLSKDVQKAMEQVQMQEIRDGDRVISAIELLGMQIQSDRIVLTYNIPLRHHSGQLELTYSMHTKTWAMKCKFLGEGRERWKRIRRWAELTEVLKGAEAKGSSIITDNELSFSWEISPDELLYPLREFSDMAAYTLVPASFASMSLENAFHQSYIRAKSTSAGMNGAALKSVLDASKKSHSPSQQQTAAELLSHLIGEPEPEVNLLEALEIGVQFSQNTNINIKQSGLKLLKSLVEKGHGFQEALEASSKSIENWEIQKTLDSLLKALIQKEYILPKTIELALLFSQHTNSEIAQNGFYSLEFLVQKGRGFQEAFEACSKPNESRDVRLAQDRLVKILIQKEYNLPKIIELALLFSQHTNSEIAQNGLGLLELLVEKGHGFQEALEACSKPNEGRDVGLAQDRLVKILIQKEYNLPKIIELALLFSQHTNSEIAQNGFRLLEFLVQKGHGFQEALEACSKPGKSWNFGFAQYRLVKTLIQKEYNLPKISELALLFSQHTNSEIAENGFRLFGLLVQKGHGFQEALEACSKPNESRSVRLVQYWLAEILIQKEYNLPKIIELAAQLPQYTNVEFRKAGFWLLNPLVEKGHGFQEALEACSKLDESEEIRNIQYDLLKLLLLKGHDIRQVLEGDNFHKFLFIDSSKASGSFSLIKTLLNNGYRRNAIQMAQRVLEEDPENRFAKELLSESWATTLEIAKLAAESWINYLNPLK